MAPMALPAADRSKSEVAECERVNREKEFGTADTSATWVVSRADEQTEIAQCIFIENRCTSENY